MSKKKANLSINTIVIIILLVIVLVVLVLILTGGMKSISGTLWQKIKSALNLWNASDVKIPTK